MTYLVRLNLSHDGVLYTPGPAGAEPVFIDLDDDAQAAPLLASGVIEEIDAGDALDDTDDDDAQDTDTDDAQAATAPRRGGRRGRAAH